MSPNEATDSSALPPLLDPPAYCHYADGPCDQTFEPVDRTTAFFAYASSPTYIADVIETSATKLERLKPEVAWETWRGLSIAGQTIFCQICKKLRQSSTLIADVTTLNFNVLFEVGFALGLGLAVVPVRDTTHTANRRAYEEFGLLDTLGYLDFSNSDELATNLAERLPVDAMPPLRVHEFRQAPLYVLKGPVNNENAIQMLAAIKKSGIRFRTYDPVETPRLSLHDARRQVAGSTAIIANLLDSAREKALAHNAQCALIAGMALAQSKAVALVAEGNEPFPIDYRDIVIVRRRANMIGAALQPTLAAALDFLQREPGGRRQSPAGLLEALDLGDVAAENEIGGLREYFVSTGQSSQARQGHARLVVGRKGAGKSAIFYDVRNSIGRGHDRLVLDLKPEGHQFTRLREFVLQNQSRGLQEHTMVAFWNYILLTELARAALEQDRTIAPRDPFRYAAYKGLADEYSNHNPGDALDFSQRLLALVDRISTSLGGIPTEDLGRQLTTIIYKGDLRALTEAVVSYCRTKNAVWVLVDNLDKGWPVRGAKPIDILIARSLLDAARKLQHQLEAREIDFDCLVFLRSDIYEQLREETPDKGKDTAIALDWDDPALFEEIIRRRINTSTSLEGNFEEVWPRICAPLVDGHSSARYIIDRTLMRPRDLLQFVRQAVHIAINCGHSKIESDDILQAEKAYSEDMLLATSFELADTHSEFIDVLYAFEGAGRRMHPSEVEDRLVQVAGLEPSTVGQVVELLLWYAFFGVATTESDDAKYSYDVHYNLRRLMYPIKANAGVLVIHPAFCSALQVN